MVHAWRQIAREMKQEATVKEVKNTYEWKKVAAPKRWNPRDPGEELCGFYVGKTARSGTYGRYEVVLVDVPDSGTFMVSGVRIIQLVDASQVEPGWPVRIVWRGYQPVGGVQGKEMKMFDFFVADGEPTAPERLPKIKETH